MQRVSLPKIGTATSGLEAARAGTQAPAKSLFARAGALADRAHLNRTFLLDVATLALGVVVARQLADNSVTRAGALWGSIFVAFVLIALKLRGMYDDRLRLSPLQDLSSIIAATSTAAILLLSVRVVSHSVSGAPAQAVRLWAGSTVCLAAGRAAAAILARGRHRTGKGQLATLILGADSVGRQIARRLADRPELGLRPVGFVDEQPLPNGGRDKSEFPLLGSTSELEAIVREHGVRHVIVAFAAAPNSVLSAAVRTCRRMGLEVSTVPRLFEDVNRRVSVEHLGGIPLLRSHPVDPSGWQFAVKYALDRLLAAVLLVLFAPLMVAIAIAVRFSVRGPILYRQPRNSRDGREFMMLKFRTMHGDEDSDGPLDAGWAAEILDIPRPVETKDRTTRVGRFLRRLSLDELPQLFNVIRGDMSLVGPRPERSSHARAFTERVHRYGDRYRVKSGLTGWAQIHGLRGATSLADRVEWDNYYIENWSLRLDFKILFLTIPAIFGRQKAV
jgi:exopolysaccharide biosynthesis polyprenyl glycosylphosphotransferase